MRRKSTRNASKSTPEKPPKELESPQKTRRSRRRKRSPSRSTESEDEVLTVTKRLPPEETPDTTTKSHTPTDEEISEEPVWKVTPQEGSPKGEIQKLKICLTRPSPDSADKKSRRSKSNSQTEDDAASSEEKPSRRTRSQGSPIIRSDGLSSQEADEEVEEKKGKGKSKGKHKSKIEKSPHLSEPQLSTNNEISENVQVTPQSPSIDKPVHIENDHKVDVDDKQNVNESFQQLENTEESEKNIGQDIDNEQLKTSEQDNSQNNESDDDEPLSVIQKTVIEHKGVPEQEETIVENVLDNHTNEVNNENKIEISEDNCHKAILEPAQTESVEENTDSSSIKDSEEKEIEKTSEENQPEQCIQQVETSEVVAEESMETTEIVEEKIDKGSTVEDTVTEQAEISEKVVESSSEEKVSVIDTEEKASVMDTEEKVSVMDTEEKVSVMDTEEKQQTEKKQLLAIKLDRNRELPVESDTNEKPQSDEPVPIKPIKSKRKWTGDATQSLLKLDLEGVQNVWPTIDFPEEPDLKVEAEKERRKSITDSSSKKLERKVSVEYKSDSERPSFEKQSSINDEENSSNIIAFNRKISIVDDTASKLKPPPSPAKNPVSTILYITNLVRPFTVKQLKELLERTGKIVEDGFWTDRIKSKCYVQYETQEEAEATRTALHGVQWPIGNGKLLIIDYATEEDMQNAKNPPAPPVTIAPEIKPATKENSEPVESKSRLEEDLKELDKKRSEGPVREWDIGKKDIRRDRSRSRERSRKHRRSPSPSDDFISRKQRKAEESVPQKLMDDLFLKTKAIPSIYWQPLSPEEIQMKQQQRLIRMEEHKRRMEESSRMKGRDMGRGAFRRRYD